MHESLQTSVKCICVLLIVFLVVYPCDTRTPRRTRSLQTERCSVPGLNPLTRICTLRGTVTQSSYWVFFPHLSTSELKRGAEIVIQRVEVPARARTKKQLPIACRHSYSSEYRYVQTSCIEPSHMTNMALDAKQTKSRISADYILHSPGFPREYSNGLTYDEQRTTFKTDSRSRYVLHLRTNEKQWSKVGTLTFQVTLYNLRKEPSSCTTALILQISLSHSHLLHHGTMFPKQRRKQERGATRKTPPGTPSCILQKKLKYPTIRRGRCEDWVDLSEILHLP
jgi:hypothetical protein